LLSVYLSGTCDGILRTPVDNLSIGAL
jgi:hypothetical protein